MVNLLIMSYQYVPNVFQYSVVAMVGILLFILSIQDIKHKEISCKWLLLFLPLIFVEIVWSQEVSLLQRVIGLCLGLFFLLLSKLTRGQIGMGDGYVLCGLGVILGFYSAMVVLSYAFLLAAIAAMILFLVFQWNRKKTIPFLPFLCLGYVGLLLS